MRSAHKETSKKALSFEQRMTIDAEMKVLSPNLTSQTEINRVREFLIAVALDEDQPVASLSFMGIRKFDKELYQFTGFSSEVYCAAIRILNKQHAGKCQYDHVFEISGVSSEAHERRDKVEEYARSLGVTLWIEAELMFAQQEEIRRRSSQKLKEPKKTGLLD